MLEAKAPAKVKNVRKGPTQKKLTFNKGQYRQTIGAELKTVTVVEKFKSTSSKQVREEKKLVQKRGPKVWMLGADIRIAALKAQHIRSIWTMVVTKTLSEGRPKTDAVWTGPFLLLAQNFHAAVDAFQQVNQMNAIVADGKGMPDAPLEAMAWADEDAVVPDRVEGLLTLAGAVTAYGAKLDADARSGERSEANADRMKVSLKSMLRFIGNKAETTIIPNKFKKPSVLAGRPLHEIGYDQLTALAANLKNRKLSKFAPDTIKTSLQHVTQFLQWLEDSGKWKPLCNYTRLLKVDKSKLMTLVEQSKLRSGQDTFTPQQLQTLYRISEERQKLFLLLGLNLCATQQQLSDLLVTDLIDLNGNEPAIHFIRGKTRHINKGQGTEGRYPLWKETADELKKHLKANKPKGDYLLSTQDGHRLVRYDAGGKKGKSKVDSVRMCWDRLLTSCGASRDGSGSFAWLPFKTLRKTTADAIKTIGGEHMQQLALAHATTSVAGRHYSGKGSAESEWEELAVLIHRLRNETFADMFTPAPEEAVKVSA